MASPPARTEISDNYPLPSDATARIGFGRLYDYVTGLLGATGDPDAARVGLGMPTTTTLEMQTGTETDIRSMSPKLVRDSAILPLGAGQTRQNLTASRAAGVVYTAPARAIELYVGVSNVGDSGSFGYGLTVTSGGVATEFSFYGINGVGTGNLFIGAPVFIPANATYKIGGLSGNGVISRWIELR